MRSIIILLAGCFACVASGVEISPTQGWQKAAQDLHVGECSSPPEALLGRIIPIEYDLFLDVDAEFWNVLKGKTRITILANDDSSKAEPKDMIVVNADQLIRIDRVSVIEAGKGKREVVEVCKVTDKQLLVIKLKDELESGVGADLIIDHRSIIRDDGKGLHKDGNSIKASFDNAEARLIVPSFDEPRFGTPISLTVSHKETMVASSPVVELDISRRGISQFKPSEPMSLQQLSFELTAKN